ncbi:putative short-chain dehydrogenase/reductase family 42E member 2 [Protopterus annectens]|uniref:putative short-chain dehydrogenase/reductase family 42E member 2 n=1 Tax=Protopterus annectens TaxID=7888 RepID=UPI001CFC43D8|nr:putative short-chain dehydrogenase/reductase family 42E member 2 [Protopterus annectens]
MNVCNMEQHKTVCKREQLTKVSDVSKTNDTSEVKSNSPLCDNGLKPGSNNTGLPHWNKISHHRHDGYTGTLNGKRCMKALVTGGGGYFGSRLGFTLAQNGIFTILLDLHKPECDVPNGAVFLQGDIRDYDTLYNACEGVDCIFHAASYGLSGPEQLDAEQIESINVGGTKTVIDVCKQRNIPRLIYTSSVNVAFGWKPVEQGDEDTVPYIPLHEHIDHYSRTKAIADKMVLEANGTFLKGGGALHTCVIRPPGIYGPEERRHLPRVAANIENGLFRFTFGNSATRMNWVHVNNLVDAHILASVALTSAKGYIASGQAYYINDGVSVNPYDWITPLFETLGYSKPRIILPTSLVYVTATLMEYLHHVLQPIVNVPVLLTRNEVQNVAVTHTFKIDKARKHLNYNPKTYDLADCVKCYIKTRPEPKNVLTVFVKALMFAGCLLLVIFLSFSFESPSITLFSKENIK